ncbi:MAG: alpha/beta fold hydrolase [Acidimicrobiales bacterium]
MELPATERVGTPDGTVLAVHRIPGEGSPIVFLHGFTGDSSAMLDLARHSCDGRPALLVDLIGHGGSDAPENVEPYRMSSVVDQVLSIVGNEPPGTVHLVGYSMGGRVAVSMAARAPWYFRSLTILSSTAGLTEPDLRAARAVHDGELADRIEQIGVESFVDEWLATPLFVHLAESLADEVYDAMRSQRLRSSAIGLANSLRGTGTGSMPPVWVSIGQLRCPVITLAGSLDERHVALARRLAELAQDGRSGTIEGVGHSLPLENPEESGAVIAAFLKGCEFKTTNLDSNPSEPS